MKSIVDLIDDDFSGRAVCNSHCQTFIVEYGSRLSLSGSLFVNYVIVMQKDSELVATPVVRCFVLDS